MELSSSNENGFCGPLDESIALDNNLILLNDVVLAGIFKFFSLDILKQCSLVCSRWRLIARTFIAKKSKFVIWIPENPNNSENSKEKIFQICETEIPFCGLKLKGFFPLKLNPFQDFLNRKIENLTELQIVECIFVDESEEKAHFDLSSFWCLPKIRKLHIDCTANPKREYCTRLTVSLGALIALDVIKLINCNIIPSKNKLCAKEIYLKNNIFLINGLEVDDVVINEFIEFNHGKVTLIGKMTLDLAEVKSIDLLDLNITKFLNWNDSEWNVNKLILWGPLSYIRNQMNIRELTFVTKFTVDLSLLPKTLEKLTFSCWRFCDAYSTGNVNLPNLKYLNLDEKSASSIIRFKTGICPNLESIEITAFMNECTFNAIQLPPSVSKLKLVNVLQDKRSAIAIPWHSGSKELHTLILQNFTWWSVNNLLPRLQPKHLVIFHNKFFYDEFNTYWTSPYLYPETCYTAFYQSREPSFPEDFLITLLNSQIYKTIDSLVLGKLSWVKFGSAFEKSYLSRIVDKKSEYYLFKRKIGSAIEEIYFKNKITL